MDDATARARVAGARVGHLATVAADGRPHVVPCCFVLDGDTIYSAVDAKPKRTTALKRLDNLRHNPVAELVVDHYDDSRWSELWWVRVSGEARVVEAASERDAALALLTAKYPQYREQPPPGPVLALRITRWRAWNGDAFG
jgi:PPOX class probable F420-dependent enzyme